MSNSVFPTLAGLGWGYIRSPLWSTKALTSASGREARTTFFSYPRYKYVLTYDLLRTGTIWNVVYTEWQTLVGFFNLRGGSYDSFLFADPEDNSATTQQFGTGDGSTTAFQLTRTLGSYNEPVFDVNSAPLIYINGVLKTVTTHYTISSVGVVTFTSAPANATVLTWTGTYYRRVRFSQDTSDFEKFAQNFWMHKKVELISLKP